MVNKTARDFLKFFLEKKLLTKKGRKACFLPENQPHFTTSEPTREPHSDGDICCSVRAL